MTEKLQSAISNNLFWFVASLVIAIMIWFVATIEANPVEQRVFNRPINILFDDSMIITSRSSETARVFVNAQESTLGILQPDDIIVSVDLTGRSAGIYTIPLDVDISRPASSDTQPTQITVEIQPRISRQLPVEVLVEPPPVNYAANTPERDIFQAVVSGAAANVDPVSRVVGEIDLSNQQTAATVERTISLFAEDAQGNRIDDVTIDPASVLVSVDVTQRDNVRTFTVRPNIDFSTLPENFEFQNVEYEPNSVMISASPEVLASLEDTIDTEPIDFENRTGDFSVSVTLDLPDDPGLIILSGSRTISVDVFISEEDTTLPFENVPVRLIGESDSPAGLSTTVNPLNISVVLTGPQSVVNTISAEDVQAIIDVNGLEAGNYTLTPQIEIAQGQITLDAADITLIPAQVSVTISAPQPEATQLPEATTAADD